MYNHLKLARLSAMERHRCLYLEQMISGRVDVTAMDANAIVKQVQRTKEHVTWLIMTDIASTNTHQLPKDVS